MNKFQYTTTSTCTFTPFPSYFSFDTLYIDIKFNISRELKISYDINPFRRYLDTHHKRLYHSIDKFLSIKLHCVPILCIIRLSVGAMVVNLYTIFLIKEPKSIKIKF